MSTEAPNVRAKLPHLVPLLGVLVIGIGLSGFVNDSGLAQFPWWAAAALGLMIVSLVLAAVQIRAIATKETQPET